MTVDEMSLAFDAKDVIRTSAYGGGNRRGLRTTDKRKITRLSSYNRIHNHNHNYNHATRSTKVYASMTSGSKSKNMKGKETNAIDDQESIYEDLLGDSDYESDNLSCFRGLVLDISYRFVLFTFVMN